MTYKLWCQHEFQAQEVVAREWLDDHTDFIADNVLFEIGLDSRLEITRRAIESCVNLESYHKITL